MQIIFTVKRNRQSVTQGTATVCMNETEVITFGDQIELITDGKSFFGQKIGDWASVKSDKDFIRAVICDKGNMNDEIERILDSIKE